VLANAKHPKNHFEKRKEPEMNTQNATSDLAANALATLAKALDSGDCAEG
jgi:hypothetical protein